MRVVVTHRFDCSPETFWRRIFFDPAYNEALFVGYLGFPSYKTNSLRETPDRVERVVRMTPPQNAPEFVRKIVKGTLSYEENGAWTAADGIYRFRTVPSMMPDKISIAGSIRAEPAGPGGMNRIVEVDIGVRVMIVGGAVERFLAGEIESSYSRAAEFTSKWIQEKGLRTA